jgi:hypothetical protein
VAYLGHLDAHFYVKQEEIQPGYWELAVLDVGMKGKGLFFKTIGVQDEMKRSMVRRVRNDLTAAQGANLLYQRVRQLAEGPIQSISINGLDYASRFPQKWMGCCELSCGDAICLWFLATIASSIGFACNRRADVRFDFPRFGSSRFGSFLM